MPKPYVVKALALFAADVTLSCDAESEDEAIDKAQEWVLDNLPLYREAVHYVDLSALDVTEEE